MTTGSENPKLLILFTRFYFLGRTNFSISFIRRRFARVPQSMYGNIKAFDGISVREVSSQKHNKNLLTHFYFRRKDDAANRPKIEFVPKTLQDLHIDLVTDGVNSTGNTGIFSISSYGREQKMRFVKYFSYMVSCLAGIVCVI